MIGTGAETLISMISSFGASKGSNLISTLISNSHAFKMEAIANSQYRAKLGVEDVKNARKYSDHLKIGRRGIVAAMFFLMPLLWFLLAYTHHPLAFSYPETKSYLFGLFKTNGTVIKTLEAFPYNFKDLSIIYGAIVGLYFGDR